ncbi:response regulator transcription factor [Amycolatopsis vastitatis]|uniref:response regulator transcription factor n=1 Tax=Amycolatopsis vastitatis TaxID=1905142 RepID=UPI0011786209|nr:response regulator transcription factor [Amycolatopsis vastitatis]
MTRRSGRPWGSLKGDDPSLHELARYLRGIVDQSSLSLKDISQVCASSDTTISKYLNGMHLPPWELVYSIISACTPAQSNVETLKKHARKLWSQASSYKSPTKISRDLSMGNAANDQVRLINALSETNHAQRQLVTLSTDLNEARKALLDSLQAHQRTSQMVFVLQFALFRLAGLIGVLTRQRDYHLKASTTQKAQLDESAIRIVEANNKRRRAEIQLTQAKEEQRRAAAIAAAAEIRVRRLEGRISETQAASQTVATDNQIPDFSTPTVDDFLLDSELGLDRMQKLLDEEDRQLRSLATATLDHNSTKIRILIVESQETLANSAARGLRDTLDCTVDIAEDPANGIALIANTDYNIVIVSTFFRKHTFTFEQELTTRPLSHDNPHLHLSGLALLEAACSSESDLEFVMWTSGEINRRLILQFALEEYDVQAFCSKDTVDQLAQAVKAALDGEPYVDQYLTDHIFDRPKATLTDNFLTHSLQRQIWRALAMGIRSHKGIARHVGMAPKSVRRHIVDMHRKLVKFDPRLTTSSPTADLIQFATVHREFFLDSTVRSLYP